MAKEFYFALSRRTVPAGPAIVELVNFGQDEHDLRIQRVGGAHIAGTPVVEPGDYYDLSITLLRDFKDQGLTGVEAYYGNYDARERHRWIQVADGRGLTCTGGSDWHGPADAHVQPGVDLPTERADALQQWLGL